MFDVVLAADLAWGIGKANALPWPKLRGDLQHFKRLTTAVSDGSTRINAVVMGRKTWESKEVAGRPLPKRRNIVVSRAELSVPAGVVAVSSLGDALAVDGGIETHFVVGGAILLQAALDRGDLRYVYLTRIEQAFDCDVKIPDLHARGFARTPWDGERTGEEAGVRYRIERLARG